MSRKNLILTAAALVLMCLALGSQADELTLTPGIDHGLNVMPGIDPRGLTVMPGIDPRGLTVMPGIDPRG